MDSLYWLATSNKSVKHLMTARIRYLETHANLASPDLAIPELRIAGLVSPHYNEQCAEIDLWYIRNERGKVRRRGGRLFNADNCSNTDDPLRWLWFQVILLAIFDVRRQRPCDLNIWFGDTPPRNEHCVNGAHLCSPSASEFIYGLTEEAIALAGLSRALIMRCLTAPDRQCLLN